MEPERKPLFTLLTAALASLTEILTACWLFAALFGGAQAAAQLERLPWTAVWVCGVVLAVLNHLLLQKRRPLLFVLGLDMLSAAGAAWAAGKIFRTESGLATMFFTAAFFIMEYMFIWWESRRLEDRTLVMQLQILLLLAASQIWLADQLKLECGWSSAVFAAAAVLLAGTVFSRASGCRSGGKTGRRRAAGGGTAALAILICGGAGLGAAVLSQPVGQAAVRGLDAAEGVFRWIMTGVAAVLRFLFNRNSIRMDASTASEDSSAAGTAEAAGGSGAENTDLIRILVYGIVILLLAFLIVTLIRILLQFAAGVRVSAGRKLRGNSEKESSLWERLRELAAELRQRMRARKILLQNPCSVAAQIVTLERRCRKSAELRRKQEETLRQFLMRLAADADTAGKKTEAEILQQLADAADRACYGREKAWLTDFAGGEALRGFDPLKPAAETAD